MAQRGSELGREDDQSLNAASRRRDERVVLIGALIDDQLANDVAGRLLHLQAADHHEPIAIHINSRGGDAGAGLAILDVIESLTVPVSTLCFGSANGMAALLLAAGTRGERQAMFHARMVLQHPELSVAGGAFDAEAQAREIRESMTRVEELFAERTGQSVDRIHSDMERGLFLGALEAQEYGLIDRIVMRR
jgi:ATP-dependent Clp protease protease subunit